MAFIVCAVCAPLCVLHDGTASCGSCVLCAPLCILRDGLCAPLCDLRDVTASRVVRILYALYASLHPSWCARAWCGSCALCASLRPTCLCAVTARATFMTGLQVMWRRSRALRVRLCACPPHCYDPVATASMRVVWTPCAVAVDPMAAIGSCCCTTSCGSCNAACCCTTCCGRSNQRAVIAV